MKTAMLAEQWTDAPAISVNQRDANTAQHASLRRCRCAFAGLAPQLLPKLAQQIIQSLIVEPVEPTACEYDGVDATHV